MINFSKYHGTGNDFIMVNQLNKAQKLDSEMIAMLCDRHLGIGADGLIELWPSERYAFKMVYYNADGKIGSMCGNGGRSVAAFAFAEHIAGSNMVFEAFDGIHDAAILNNSLNEYLVDIQMADVDNYNFHDNQLIVDTGSPHHVSLVDNLSEFDVFGQGKSIRHDKNISKNGVNVNFVQKKDNQIFVRTYERGVENETLSCGTGVTATAIAANIWYGGQNFQIQTRGGELSVSFSRDGQVFRNIHLIGPVQKVFEGKIDINQKFTKARWC